MKTIHKKITVADLVDGFADSGVNGVVGFSGALDIRPKYQREFVYDLDKQEAVINTVMHGYPLNIMYWNDNGNGEYEVIDGQQRTLSICKFHQNEFAWNNKDKEHAFLYQNLAGAQKDKFLGYELDVYVCQGDEGEKLEWFKTINIAGEPLTDQELLNAVYAGPFTKCAKNKFANPEGFPLAPDNSQLDDGGYTKYLKFGGSYKNFAKRQEFLELALTWIAGKNEVSIDEYMSQHQNDTNSNEMWQYFKAVIEWVQSVFLEYHKDMQRKDWNRLYEANKNRTDLDPKALQNEIEALRGDYDVKNKRGIYDYVLSDHELKDEKYLNLRAFDRPTVETAYAKCNGICASCGEHFELEEMDADHITPWSKGGKTEPDNCQMLCKHCNRSKSNK